MSDDSRDRDLGMDRKITRRDFLNGVSVAVGGTLLGSRIAALDAVDGSGAPYAPETDPGYYPPAVMGMRGNHEGTYAYAHQLRDGDFAATKPADTGEKYDLVIVGGGISGLAAAHFYRKQAGTGARILILDNHDDFGGHAKRNEFTVGKRLLLCNGGTQSIENPGEYSRVARQLLVELGIQTGRFYQDYDRTLYAKLKTGCFYDRETFGEDRLVTGMGSLPWKEFLARSPLSSVARHDIERIYTEKIDYMSGLSKQEKKKQLAKMSYADFLTKVCKIHADALPFFQKYPHDLFAVGIEAVSALACYNNGDDYDSISYPGFDGLGLDATREEEPYIFHFPDGNASVARLLVRSLIPGSIPGHTMEDLVTSRARYNLLDEDQSRIRIRLNSTVVRARHLSESDFSQGVAIDYMRGERLQSVVANNCILACYNMMIPYLCPELPAKQKEALSYNVKAPLVYTRVAVRNWTAFQNLGIHHIVAPGGYHSYVALDFPVSIGNYRFPARPEEPAVLFLLRTPCRPGLPRQQQYRMGRVELFTTPFATFERNIRDQLGRMLGASGFDPARDIEGITVNRWAHGYAYEYESLSDPDWPPNQRPCVIGRQRFGRIAIANSDAGASAYTNVAIDQAYRAVGELIALKPTPGRQA